MPSATTFHNKQQLYAASSVVACTLSAAALDDVLEVSYDMVIIDEVSVADVPFQFNLIVVQFIFFYAVDGCMQGIVLSDV